ncbi:MAG: helix-turn-helix transcriptional regulator [Clostridia bacterium]|nr:helix-turn-helix transcriptional regulator [Clostridia bacterium]
MNRIKELRNEKGLLQSDVAKYIGKSERIVGFYENGERDPNTDTLLKLSELFDVSVDYILGKTNTKNTKSISLDDIDIAFASGIRGLNKENQETLKDIMKGLLAKQELENQEED